MSGSKGSLRNGSGALNDEENPEQFLNIKKKNHHYINVAFTGQTPFSIIKGKSLSDRLILKDCSIIMKHLTGSAKGPCKSSVCGSGATYDWC